MSMLEVLPKDGNVQQWNDQEKALVEAAGLVSRGNLAPRPTVEAFLHHCRRTGLDPIARQIYAIERGGKWGIQVSIDGARLIAERSKQYRGQTVAQWTADGVTWVDVWLSKEPPAAARVGVYREGFVEPLVAVATWDQYQAGGPMWKKMPALMLSKTAEMLALRKAFPQDLSGLYSSEEMDQADAAPARGAAPVSAPEPVEQVVEAELVEETGLDAQKAAAQSRLDALKAADEVAKGVLGRLEGADVDTLRGLYVEAREGNALNVLVAHSSGEQMELGALIQQLAADVKAEES